MTKRLFLFVGVIIGFLLGELVRRKKLERLAMFEAKEVRRKARHAQNEREFQAELATMPFDERMEYEMWEAGMRLNNWMPPLYDLEDDKASET